MFSARHLTRQRRLTGLRGWVVPWALALLLVAQSLALVHGLVHHADPNHASPAGHAGLLDDLFAGHSDTDCRLFDQHAPTDLAPLPVQALPFDLTPPSHTGHAPAVPQAARLRAFRARDPPFLA